MLTVFLYLHIVDRPASYRKDILSKREEKIPKPYANMFAIQRP